MEKGGAMNRVKDIQNHNDLRAQPDTRTVEVSYGDFTFWVISSPLIEDSVLVMPNDRVNYPCFSCGFRTSRRVLEVTRDGKMIRGVRVICKDCWPIYELHYRAANLDAILVTAAAQRYKFSVAFFTIGRRAAEVSRLRDYAEILRTSGRLIDQPPVQLLETSAASEAPEPPVRRDTAVLLEETDALLEAMDDLLNPAAD